MSGNGNVPTEEEFAKASAKLKCRSRGLDQVRSKVLKSFQSSNELHEFFIFDSSDNSFVAYIFFQSKEQIDQAQRSGLLSKIYDEIFEALEKAGRGNRNEIHVDFEIDSHENVELNYGGDYYSRLR